MSVKSKRLVWRARYGKPEYVQMESGTLIVKPGASDIHIAAEALNAHRTDMRLPVEIPDLLGRMHEWA